MRLSILSIFLLCTIGLLSAQEPVFVVNKESKLTTLSAEDIKNIMLGNKLKFDDGVNIKLATLEDGPVHEKVVRDYTQRSTDQFEKYWKRLVFTGKGIMSEQFKTDAELIDYVAKTPGGIGYVDKASVTPTVNVIEIK